ncbi:MAG: hypothetical protein Q9181_001175 [Wetmoreana brouardii]
MPYFSDSQQWLHQSNLLLAARPTTSRITTKYRISPPPPPRKRKSTTTDSQSVSAATSPPPPQQQPLQSRAHLVLKTYDPVSGVCLKYKTDKAAEVGRLVAALGKCGRAMAGLPPKEEREVDGGEGDAKDMREETEVRPAAVSGKDERKGPEKSGAQGQQGQGKGGGGGKRKKGKR